MSSTQDLISVAQAATELGLTPSAVRNAIAYGSLRAKRIDGRTNMIQRGELERYRDENRGRRGKRMQPADALTEQQPKQRPHQAPYYQRKKEARKQQPAEPAEEYARRNRRDAAYTRRPDIGKAGSHAPSS